MFPDVFSVAQYLPKILQNCSIEFQSGWGFNVDLIAGKFGDGRLARSSSLFGA